MLVRMFQTCLFSVIALALANPMLSYAQKAKPKRISINEPKDVEKEQDFAIQGEYAGEIITVDNEKLTLGIQVIALGEGKFTYKGFTGGLPGAGYDGRKIESGPIATVDGQVIVYEPRPNSKIVIGSIQDGVLSLTKFGKGTLKKVNRASPTLGAKPPEGAKVLFSTSGDEQNWTNGKIVELSDGKYLNVGVKTKDKFGSFKAHVEFRLPYMPDSSGQARGNSGVYLQDRYEIQILDSFGLSGADNECGGIYKQHKPKVNMCLPPMVWQTYDIEFTAAKFDGDKKVAPARLTLLHNGIKIHDNVEFQGSTGGGQKEAPTPGPLQLQNHSNPVVFQNIWIVESN